MIKKNKKRIVLLDTHAIIHRAYHALPDFTGPTGTPTGALYGLVSMLLKIITDLKPDYIFACYDLPKPTIRHEAYADYKGTRAKTDDALAIQLGESRKIFEAFSIPMYEREGFEADDLLGTIAHELKEEKGVDVIIASGDMDTLQLIQGRRVQVYTLKKGINDTILYDEKAVITRFGFGPKLIPDWKGLRGDPSDNIPGVRGIGEKTALTLVKEFGSVDGVFERLDEVKGAVKQKLKENEQLARDSRYLALIDCEVPVQFDIEELRPKKPDENRLGEFFKRFGKDNRGSAVSKEL